MMSTTVVMAGEATTAGSRRTARAMMGRAAPISVDAAKIYRDEIAKVTDQPVKLV